MEKEKIDLTKIYLYAIKRLFYVGGLQRYEQIQVGNTPIQVIVPAELENNVLKCNYSFFDKKALQPPYVTNENPEPCWMKVLDAAQALVDNNLSTDDRIWGWINFALGAEIANSVTPIQTCDYLFTERKTREEQERSSSWIHSRSEELGVQEDELQKVLSYDSKFYSGSLVETIYCYRKTDNLLLRDDANQLLVHLKKTLDKEYRKTNEYLTESYIALQTVKLNEAAGRPVITKEFLEESLSSPNDKHYISAWHVLETFLNSIERSSDQENPRELMEAIVTALMNKEIRTLFFET